MNMLSDVKWELPIVLYRTILSQCGSTVFDSYTTSMRERQQLNSSLNTFLQEKQGITQKMTLKAFVESGNLQSYSKQSIYLT